MVKEKINQHVLQAQRPQLESLSTVALGFRLQTTLNAGGSMVPVPSHIARQKQCWETPECRSSSGNYELLEQPFLFLSKGEAAGRPPKSS